MPTFTPQFPFLFWALAVLELVSAAFELRDQDYSRGTSSVALGLLFGILASGAAERNRWVRWVGYAAALIGTVLIGLRLLARTT